MPVESVSKEACITAGIIFLNHDQGHLITLATNKNHDCNVTVDVIFNTVYVQGFTDAYFMDVRCLRNS